jgi:hypothetical protein
MEPLSSTVVPRETSKPRPTDPPRHQKFLSPFRQKTTRASPLPVSLMTDNTLYACTIGQGLWVRDVRGWLSPRSPHIGSIESNV